jgi:hypothetical protein
MKEIKVIAVYEQQKILPFSGTQRTKMLRYTVTLKTFHKMGPERSLVKTRVNSL